MFRWPNLQKSPCPSGRNLTQRAATRAAAGFKPAERGPGGGLTATYCTPWGRMKMSFGVGVGVGVGIGVGVGVGVGVDVDVDVDAVVIAVDVDGDVVVVAAAAGDAVVDVGMLKMLGWS